MFGPGGQRDYSAAFAYGGGKGGGGGQAYQPPAPTILTDPVTGKSFIQSNSPYDYDPSKPSAAEQLNAEIDARNAQAKTDTAAAKQQQTQTTADDTAAKEATFQSNRQTAYDNAMKNAIRQFQLQGVDPNQYMESDIKPQLKQQFDAIQDLDPNPAAAFTPDLGSSIMSNALSGKRTQASNSLNSLFTPTYAQDAIPDSLTGQYADTILNEQFNAQKRGTLGGAGYQAAVDALNQKRTAAGATIQSLGAGILSADRSGVNDYISGARGDVNNLALNSNFDPSMYSAGASNKVQSAIGSFGGALRNAVGDTKFADITDLINAGGAAQGAQNPNAANPGGKPLTATGGGALSPDYMSEEDLAKQKRGLGSTGAF
jgi:hypothetical protein